MADTAPFAEAPAVPEQQKIDIHWLDPVQLIVDAQDDDKLLADLRRQLREGYRAQGVTEEQMTRSVYIIRLTGSFLIEYPRCNSPVLYVGRGDAPNRLATHLARWLSDAFWFGSDTQVEVRMLRPRRRGRRDYFKNVEADLIDMFLERAGALPFFNRCREPKFSGRIDYGPSQDRRLRQLLGTGSGKRPHWALSPTPANPHYDTYWTGPTR